MPRCIKTAAALVVAAVALGAPAAQGATISLPDGRGWEMVSPVDKNGGEIQAPGEIFGGGVLQSAVDGSTITYSSSSSFVGPQASSSASQYISRRTAAGWATENVTTAALAGAFGDKPDGVPYQLFSADLARGLISSPQRCEGTPCPRGFDLRQSSSGALAASVEEPDLGFAGASPDLGHVVLSTCAALTPEATEVPVGSGECDVAETNLYMWSGAGLNLINILPGDVEGAPGATLAAQSAAVSADGSRVYFDVGGNLYLREGGQTTRVDDAAEVGGGGEFQTASANGSIAFFTKAGRLYRYGVAGDAVVPLTASGEVEGVLGASADGSYVYYATAAGLLLNHNAGATPITVAAAADATNYPPATGTARVAANGTVAFLSSTPLKGFNNAGYSEAYLYSPAPATLTCASCNPRGMRPIGPATIPGAFANGTGATSTDVYKPRALSADGTRLFFDSRDALVGEDSNADQDVYEWEAQGTGSCAKPSGCIALISSGRSTEGASFVDASVDGSDAFFLTDGSLVPTDPGLVDLYNARVGGGFPSPTPPIACFADACQGVPGEPEDLTPGTAYFRPEGNVPVSHPKVKKKHHRKGHHRKRHHKKHRKSSHRRRANARSAGHG
jgi:hypothetical protein